MNINPRILGACCIGALLIVSAYFFAPAHNQSVTGDANTEIAQQTAREFIEVGDRDNDGVPDWSESFRQADVPIIDQTTLEEPGEAYTPPDTLTGQLAIDLFSKMVQGETRGPLGPSQEDILNSADRKFTEAATDELYTLSDLTITSADDIETLHAYGNRVAEIIVTYIPGSETRNEIDIIQHSVQSQKPEVLEELLPIIDAYSKILSALLKTPVPSTVAEDHLNMVNAFNAMLIDLEGMQKTYDDPMYTIVRMQRYYDDAVGRNNAIVNIYNKLDSQGVIWSDQDIVAQLIAF